MLDGRRCDVNNAVDLDGEIRSIFALDQVGRGDEISGTLAIDYVGEATKQASLIPALERRGVEIVWRKKQGVCKGYYRGSQQHPAGPDGRAKIDYDFNRHQENARVYSTRVSADDGRKLLEAADVEIDAVWGGKFNCRDFVVEEIAQDRFVIYCEAPFVSMPGESTNPA